MELIQVRGHGDAMKGIIKSLQKYVFRIKAVCRPLTLHNGICPPLKH